MDSLLEDWLKKEEKIRQENRRGYCHFDVNHSVQSCLEMILDPKKVAGMSFFPFIHYVDETTRVKFDKDAGKRKRTVKERPIKYAAHRDAFVFSWYAFRLQVAYENWLQGQSCVSSVIAYRKIARKTNLHFATEAFERIRERKRSTVALAFDVVSFFDNLNHGILLENWKTLVAGGRLNEGEFAVFKANTAFSYVDREELEKILGIKPGRWIPRYCSARQFRALRKSHPKLIQKNKDGKGVPQGSPISAVLSNVYMMGFDVEMKAFADGIGGNYFRYSDDVLVICDHEHEDLAVSMAMKCLNKIGLEIKEEKNDFTRFDYGSDGTLKGRKGSKPKRMQYLGLEFDGQRISVRSSSVARYHRKLRKAVRRALQQRFGKNSQSDKVFKRKLYRNYSHKGTKNFISYVYRAAEISGATKIKAQVKGNLELINELIHALAPKVSDRMKKRREWNKEQNR